MPRNKHRRRPTAHRRANNKVPLTTEERLVDTMIDDLITIGDLQVLDILPPSLSLFKAQLEAELTTELELIPVVSSSLFIQIKAPSIGDFSKSCTRMCNSMRHSNCSHGQFAPAAQQMPICEYVAKNCTLSMLRSPEPTEGPVLDIGKLVQEQFENQERSKTEKAKRKGKAPYAMTTCVPAASRPRPSPVTKKTTSLTITRLKKKKTYKTLNLTYCADPSVPPPSYEDYADYLPEIPGKGSRAFEQRHQAYGLMAAAGVSDKESPRFEGNTYTFTIGHKIIMLNPGNLTDDDIRGIIQSLNEYDKMRFKDFFLKLSEIAAELD